MPRGRLILTVMVIEPSPGRFLAVRERLPTRRGRMVIALTCLVIAISLAACVSKPRPAPDPPKASPAGPPAAASGSCFIRYSLETLKQREFAFDGTAVAIGNKRYEGPEGGEDRGTATFRVNRWFKGGEGPEVTLESGLPAQNGVVASVEGADVREGGRYLVAGEGKFMGTCGFTRDWSEEEAAEWDSTLRGS